MELASITFVVGLFCSSFMTPVFLLSSCVRISFLVVACNGVFLTGLGLALRFVVGDTLMTELSGMSCIPSSTRISSLFSISDKLKMKSFNYKRNNCVEPYNRVFVYSF